MIKRPSHRKSQTLLDIHECQKSLVTLSERKIDSVCCYPPLSWCAAIYLLTPERSNGPLWLYEFMQKVFLKCLLCACMLLGDSVTALNMAYRLPRSNHFLGQAVSWKRLGRRWGRNVKLCRNCNSNQLAGHWDNTSCTLLIFGPRVVRIRSWVRFCF